MEGKMKRKKLVFLGILMLFVASLVLAEDQEKEISVDEAMKCFCTTWINPAYYESYRYTGIKIMNKDGSFEFYQNETSEDPAQGANIKLKRVGLIKTAVFGSMCFSMKGGRKNTPW
jgi:hypothetical protein